MRAADGDRAINGTKIFAMGKTPMILRRNDPLGMTCLIDPAFSLQAQNAL